MALACAGLRPALISVAMLAAMTALLLPRFNGIEYLPPERLRGFLCAQHSPRGRPLKKLGRLLLGCLFGLIGIGQSDDK
jgi:hypothetical protein